MGDLTLDDDYTRTSTPVTPGKPAGADVTYPAAPKQTLLSRLLETVWDYPFPSISVASLALIGVYINVTYLRTSPVWDAVNGASAPLTSVIVTALNGVIVTSTTVTVMQIAAAILNKQDRIKNDKFKEDVKTAFAEIATVVRRVAADGDIAHEKVDAIERSLIGTTVPSAHVRPNTSEEWARSVAGSEWWAVAPRGLRDVTWLVRPDGSFGCEVAESRIMPWLDRIGRNAVSRFTVILFTPISAEEFGTAPEEVRQRFLRPIATQLASFRVAQVLAAERGVHLHLDRVQIVIRADPFWLKKPSFFVGATRLPSGIVPYAITYTNFKEVFDDIPVTYLDDKITTWFEPNQVIAHRHLAEQLLLGQKIWALTDVEREFGTLCPQPTIKRDGPATRTGLPLQPSTFQQPGDEWVTDGVDHIANVRRTPRT